MKTREQVEELKRQWLSDGCWDIETTEGFEDYHDELLKFRLSIEGKYIAENELLRKKLAKKFCPMKADANKNGALMGDITCDVENCAWWHENRKCCSMIFLAHLEDIAEATKEHSK